jgi:hypothetical protein
MTGKKMLWRLGFDKVYNVAWLGDEFEVVRVAGAWFNMSAIMW